jgi:putative RNA 2'-phosphotransferase
MIDQRRLIKLSKFLALILRHQPERFALALDDEGWASLSEVMEILKGLPNFRWANRSDVMHVVEQGAGDGKKRFQVEGSRIRALYGHSFDRLIRHEPATPPVSTTARRQTRCLSSAARDSSLWSVNTSICRLIARQPPRSGPVTPQAPS